MTREACHLPGLTRVTSAVGREERHLRAEAAYQALKPKPQTGKSFEASVKEVPRVLLTEDSLGPVASLSTKRNPSNFV